MKKLVTITILVILVCTVLAQFAVVSSEGESYEVVRGVEVKDCGLMYISDSLYVEPGRTIKVGFDIALKDKLVAFYAEQATIETRYVEEESPPSLFFIEMRNVGEQTVRANLVTVFKGLVTEEDSKTFVANVPMLPVIKKTVASFYMVVRFPSGSEVELPERPGFNYTTAMDGVFTEAKDIDLLLPTSVSVRFMNDKVSIVSVEKADVTVFVGNPRQVSFFLKIVNHGKSSINEVKLLLPTNATLLNVKDSLGALSSSYVRETGSLVVKTRWDVKSGEKVSFTVEYLEPYAHESGYTYVLSYPSLLDTVYGRYSLKVILSPGYDFKGSSPEPEELVRDQSGATMLSYVSGSVATLQPKTAISISYIAGVSIMPYLPYLWIATFGVLLTTAVTYRLSRRPKAPMLPEEVKEAIKTVTSKVFEVVKACERLASSIPLDKKSISRWSRSAYESELTTVKRDVDRISALKKRLGGFPEIMAKLGPLETQISELVGIMTALSRTIEDFRLGRIGKATYDRITKEYAKDISSLTSRIRETTREIETSLR
ncbi:MAG: hypothetical protein QXO01_00785 [Nitrososphaerota archaeon]